MEPSGSKSSNKVTTNPNLPPSSKTTTPTFRGKPPGSGSTAKGRPIVPVSTASGSRAAVPVKLKQNLFAVKSQPMKIKTNLGAGAGVGIGNGHGTGIGRAPMNLNLPTGSNSNSTSNSNNSGDISVLTKTLRVPQEASNPFMDDDEEILDALYTRYLQLRLLAQIASKRRTSSHDSNLNNLAAVHFDQVMDKKCYEVQYRSLAKIEKQIEHLEKIESMEKDLNPLVVQICEDAVSPSFTEFEQKLSEKLDVLPFPNRELETLNCEPLTEPDETLQKVWSSDENPMGFIASAVNTREDVQQIYDASTSDERAVNEQITKLISLKICKSYLT